MEILNTVSTALNSQANMAKLDIPNMLTAGAELRTGMLTSRCASNVLRKLSEQGFNVNKLDNGQDNMLSQLVITIIDGIFEEMHMNAKIISTTPPGGEVVEARGGNAGGPIVAIGENKSYSKTTGVII